MKTLSTFALAALLALPACSKKSEATGKPAAVTAPVTAGTTVGGVRKIPVEASIKGYTPATIQAKAGEQLVLVVTRTQDGECLSELKVGTGAPVKLPMNTAVEIPVTAPASGELAFACGMDMFKGTIVVGS